MLKDKAVHHKANPLSGLIRCICTWVTRLIHKAPFRPSEGVWLYFFPQSSVLTDDLWLL